MDEHRKDRLKVWTPLFFSVVMVVGMMLGYNMRDSLRKHDPRQDRLNKIIDLINNKYVDTINSNLMYKDAVSGILKSLDPHTVFIPADEVQGINDDMEGEFSGIGVEFALLRDTISVVAVIDKGPALAAGIEVGDKLLKVDDSVVAGIHITTERIIHLLKGRQKSTVSVTVKQIAGKIKQVRITRDLIPTYSVDASLMLDATTGFIKINRFSATTYDEFKAALKKLQAAGASQLIIDLRDNPGGYLDQASSIADELLNDNKLVVYTKGLHTPKTEYRAGEKGLFEDGKLAILVDEGSASASEILAGAIQDWDRGVILGRRTFGKGLVQEQYDLPDGSALRLTIAKYYTPSGRCIQRSFAGGKEAYMEDYEKRLENGELTGTDSFKVTDTTKYYTGKHRVVYGGGGIKPDVYVPYDTLRLSPALLSIIYSEDLKNAIWDYFIRNKAQLKYKTVADFAASFNAQQQIADNYISMLSGEARAKAQKALSSPVSRQYFDLQIKSQLARFLFRDNGYYTISLKEDDVAQKALQILNSDSYSKILGN